MARKPSPEKSWPIANVEWRKTGTLKQSAGNPKEHPQDQVEEILALINQFGWTNPILVDEEDNIIAGHGRQLAAIKGNLPNVAVIVAKGWTEAQKIAYRLSDNHTAAKSTWRPEMITADMAALKEMNFDIESIGLDTILELPELEDIIPAPPKTPRSKTTIFVSVLNQDVEKARKAIISALERAKIPSNL